MKPRCSRCGEPLPCVDATTMSDLEPRYIPTRDCECPAPRCPFCHTKSDDGKCWNIDCFLVGNIIPIPEMS